MNNEFIKNLYANSIGMQIANYLEELRPELFALTVDSNAIELLAEIIAILEDDTLEDSQCFSKISAIITAFESKGVPIKRHDW